MSHGLLPDVGKIAVLRPNAIGDFVFSLPSLHAMKRAYPAAQLTYVGQQWHAGFLAGRPGPIDQVMVMPPCPGIGLPPSAVVDAEPMRHFVSAMRAARFDVALQMYGGGRYSNPLVSQCGAQLTAGLKAADAVPLDRWVAYGPLQNRRLQLLEVASLIGAGDVHLGTELAVTAGDRQQAAKILPDTDATPVVVIHPGATDERRRWPSRCFAKVADMLAGEGARIVVTGSIAEAPVVREMIEHMHCPATDLSGRLSLPALCGVLDRAAMLVSNDTGPLHLALAIGTPCVGIYWLTNLIEAGPLRQHFHVPVVSWQTDCPVCGMPNISRRCAHESSFVKDVTQEEVSAAAHALFIGTEHNWQAASCQVNGT